MRPTAPSSMVSKYWFWFAEMGYPELDIVTWPDGEWAIIEYLNAPIIPPLTKWNYVLTGLRNQEITYDFLKAYADQHCLEKRFVWEEQQRKEDEAAAELKKRDERDEDFQRRAHKIITSCPDLMHRIATEGPSAMSLKSMWRHIPKSRLGTRRV